MIEAVWFLNHKNFIKLWDDWICIFFKDNQGGGFLNHAGYLGYCHVTWLFNNGFALYYRMVCPEELFRYFYVFIYRRLWNIFIILGFCYKRQLVTFNSFDVNDYNYNDSFLSGPFQKGFSFLWWKMSLKGVRVSIRRAAYRKFYNFLTDYVWFPPTLAPLN